MFRMSTTLNFLHTMGEYPIVFAPEYSSDRMVYALSSKFWKTLGDILSGPAALLGAKDEQAYLTRIG